MDKQIILATEPATVPNSPCSIQSTLCFPVAKNFYCVGRPQIDRLGAFSGGKYIIRNILLFNVNHPRLVLTAVRFRGENCPERGVNML